MSCKYCKKGFSCGCQKTKGADGSTVHKSCLTNYNNSLTKTASVKDPLTKQLTQAVNNISNGAR